MGVDTSKYDVLKLWVLGRETVQRQHSLLKKLTLALSGQSTRSEFVSYRRVIAAVRLKSDDKLTLKAFKDIPSSHLEKLLPAGKIKMGRFDRYMIGASVSLSALGILAKFVTVLAKMTVNWMLGFAAITGLLGLRGYIAYKNKRGMYLRSEEHTSELQSRPHISYAVFCLKKKNNTLPLQCGPPPRCHVTCAARCTGGTS